jgi:hypothetical protein
MSKKRAFVRYTKSGEIVPGSLILTNGSYPDKPALWKEITTDKCCDTGGDCTPQEAIGVAEIAQEGLFTSTFIQIQMYITCRDVIGSYPYSSVIFVNRVDLPNITFTNWNDIINTLNTSFSQIGTFSYLGGTSVQLTTNTEYISCIDPEVEISFSTP